MSDTDPQTDVAPEATPETPVATEGGSVRKRVKLEDFIVAWEDVANSNKPSVQAVADRLGITKASVQQRATIIRNPPKTKKLEDGTKVEIPVEQRAVAIPLTKMPRGGPSYNGASGLELFNKLVAQREAAKAAAEGEGEGEESDS